METSSRRKWSALLALAVAAGVVACVAGEEEEEGAAALWPCPAAAVLGNVTLQQIEGDWHLLKVAVPSPFSAEILCRVVFNIQPQENGTAGVQTFVLYASLQLSPTGMNNFPNFTVDFNPQAPGEWTIGERRTRVAVLSEELNVMTLAMCDNNRTETLSVLRLGRGVSLDAAAQEQLDAAEAAAGVATTYTAVQRDNALCHQ